MLQRLETWVDRHDDTLFRLFSAFSANPGVDGIPAIGEEIVGERYLGAGGSFNSPEVVTQLIRTLHCIEGSRLNAILDRVPPSTGAKGVVQVLLSERPLQGQKILDLGCGVFPTYARACRAFGAEAWGVDVIAKEQLVDNSRDRRFTREDQANYIPVDLNDEKAIERICQASGGEFSIISEAHLATGWYWEVDELASGLGSGRGVSEFSAKIHPARYEPLLRRGGRLLAQDRYVRL